uniref:SJCHGC07082 protein n=1 Tax=Schistosoma japonicum TaxID=6182 RepID=Q5BRX7_SCHJA|nr:SJCHGC07082 protein [Schistosoma japonicum]
MKVLTITRRNSHKTDTTSTNSNNNQNNRRDSYQDSLKDMAALMTDVELTDDVIKSMRQRFDLQQ